MRHRTLIFLSAFFVSLSMPSLVISILGEAAYADVQPEESAWIAERLQKVIETFPSMRINSDPKALYQTVSELFGVKDAIRFRDFVEKNRSNFLTIRTLLLTKIPIRLNGKTIAVSGRSVVGLSHALLLVKMGYNVEVFDKRTEKTRNIQWALRQALLDQMAALDPKLASQVQDLVARPLVSSVHLGADGSRAEYTPPAVRTPDPTQTPESGQEMLQLPSVMTVEAKKLERALENFLQTYSNQVKIINEPLEITEPDRDGRYSVKTRNTDYDEIVIAEGSNSENRTKAGIKSIRTTAARLQIAGQIHVSTNGKMSKLYRTENGDSMISYTMETKDSNRVWLVADVHAESVEPDASFTKFVGEKFKKGTPEYETEQAQLNKAFELEKQRKISIEFRRLAGPLLGISPESMKTLKITGAMEKSELPSLFWLEQRISSDGTAGSNLRLAGDAVGNATPTVGGGMQVGATSHLESAKKMYLEIDILKYRLETGKINETVFDEKKKLAFKRYGRRAQMDSMAWHSLGVPDMYLYINAGGVPVDKLPESHKWANDFNYLVDKLNRELSQINAEKIREMSKQTKDAYYKVPPEEITTDAGINKWIKKVKDWAYQDFLKRTLHFGVVEWMKGNVESPYNYLNSVLPERPSSGNRVPSWMPSANKPSGRQSVNSCQSFYGVSF